MGAKARDGQNEERPYSTENFTKLKTAKYLKAQANANQAEVFFTGQVQRLARIHHYGLRDKVNRRGTMVKYPERPLIGVNADVDGSVKDVLLRWLI